MATLRCLYFDDEPKVRERYAGWIKRAWDNLNEGVPIEVHTAASTDEAEKKLKEAKGTFDMFLTDLLVGKTNEDLGLRAISNAKEDYAKEGYPPLAIIALSVGDPKLAQEALEAGAHEFMPKRLMNNSKENHLGKRMLSALRKCGREPATSSPDVLAIDEMDFPQASVIETVERKNVINFANRAVKHRCSAIRPTFIRAGLSGAAVLRIDCDFELGDVKHKRSESRSLLLKMSRTQDSLAAELRKNTSGFHDLFIPFTGDEPIQSGDWYAIASNFRVGGRTLVDWLVAPDNSLVRVPDVLASLFLDPEKGLNLVYRSIGTLSDERPNVALWNLLSLGRRARTRQALDELGRLALKYDPSGVFDEKLITDFLTAKRVDDLNEESIRPGFTYCLSHGDLHGRNILVGTNPTASLIDPANIGELHWAADVARLMVDLVSSAWDHGDHSHEWDHLPEWFKISQSLVRNYFEDYQGEKGAPNERVHAAIRWLRDNLFEIHKLEDQALKPEWEFRLALAIEFMRAAYRQQDLTSPKRVLGLISACDALREAAASYREFA